MFHDIRESGLILVSGSSNGGVGGLIQLVPMVGEGGSGERKTPLAERHTTTRHLATFRSMCMIGGLEGTYFLGLRTFELVVLSVFLRERPTQLPDWHLSPFVNLSPSEQGVPSATSNSTQPSTESQAGA